MAYEAEIESIKKYYADLLILQYRNKPKARETIKMFVDICMGDGLVFELNDCLNIDTAVGKQLDLIGQILGCNRNVYGLTPDAKWFTFEKTGAYGYSDKNALSEGYWKTYFNSSGSAYALSDSDYRQLLKFKAAINVMPATMKGMDEALYQVFGDNVTIQNNQDLSITYVINQQTIVTQAAEILGYFKAPMGIAVNYSYGSST